MAAAVAAVLCITLFIIANIGTAATEDRQDADTANIDTIPAKPAVMKYGLPIEEFIVAYDTIKPRETLAEVLFGFGFNAQQIHELTQ